MPKFYQVTINGIPLKKSLNKREAEIMAERWQGSHAGGRGLLKHKDRGDYVEVSRDTQAEREFDMRWDEAKRGNPQKLYFEGGS